ncbi:OLC1v1027240C1 [Oldenlandia corymbosa var. corymbosa]|uniref:OLC1v1027240C1 n=1 Tax=Oldenlandia corymbosa var. corymbosa TaxID=529605 RepID=A0AAV1C9K5_OLDCO|nr:OLC1v1027240C1 [Oldenlandia corymbosa var. corymbosa]
MVLQSCTFDLINLAPSNSLVAFCFCNLIIAILLVASSKPGGNTSPDRYEEYPPIPLKKDSLADHTGHWRQGDDMKEVTEESDEVTEAVSVSHAIIIHSEVTDVDDGDDDCESEEDDDELRRRVEEFIDKVNRGWKAENLRMCTS